MMGAKKLAVFKAELRALQQCEGDQNHTLELFVENDSRCTICARYFSAEETKTLDLWSFKDKQHTKRD